MNNVEQINIHKGREVIYSILSNMFLFIPSDDIFKKASVLINFLDNIDDNENDMLVDGLINLKKFMDKRSSLLEEERKALEHGVSLSYTSLFCLGSGVPTSESVYVSPAHLEMQENEIKVSYIYRNNHFKMNHTSNEPKDHISYELMFMSFLSKITSQAIENNDAEKVNHLLKTQIDFLKDHLINFATQFVKKAISIKVDISFYGPICYILLGFIKADYEFLKSLTEN